MAPVVSTVLLHGQSPGLIRATCAAGLSKCPTEPAPLLEFRPWVTHSIPTLFTLDMSARRKGCCANRKSDFHEAIYDARVYTIMVLTVCIPLGSITSELPPVRWIGLTPHPPGGCFFAYAHSSSV